MGLMQVKRRSRRKTGFSLMEIMLVIVILGVLVGIALPRYGVAVEKTKSAEAVHILTALRDAQEVYNYENSSYATDINDLDVTIPVSKYFSAPTARTSISGNGYLATMQRKDGSYYMGVGMNSTIVCFGNATLCTRMGY